MPTSQVARSSRRAFLAALLASAPLALGARAAGQDAPSVGAAPASEAPVMFEQRAGFVPTEVDAPPIRARRSGVSAADVYALPVQALGRVDTLTVADIGAGRGRHLAAISSAVGAEGRLFATEISDTGCGGLRSVASEAGLANVAVVRGDAADVGLEEGSVDVALLSDVYQFVMLLDGRRGQDKHGFLTSLHRALAPDGEVVVTYVTSSELKEDDTRRALIDRTLADFTAYGFEAGRRWVLDGPHWPVLVFEFRSPEGGPASPERYLGREIARTMHWQGAGWLVRSERAREENSARMLAGLEIEAGQTVADFGCGNGYHTLEMARAAGPSGKAFGVDIQPEMLEMLEARAARAELANVVPLLGAALAAPLPPESCDLVLLADVYHELSHPVPILAVIRRALKADGRVAVLEFRAEDPEVPIKPLHKMTRAQVLLEFEANGFELASEMDELPWQHLMFFRAARE